MRSDFSHVALPDLPPIQGMITAAERRYLYWVTSRGYTGAGTVVEVGPWLGCSSVHLAAGLRDAGFADAFHCFDKFRWGPLYASRSSLPLRPGDDFQAYFEQNIRPVYPNVRVTKSAVEDLVWDRGPIELLFLDAPKKLEDVSAALAAFAPALVPGLSLLIVQDYLHAPSYALAAVLGRLARELELLHVVEDGTTVSFAVRKPLAHHLAQPVDWNFRRWSRAETHAAWRRILEPLPASARSRLGPGLAMMLFDQGAVEEALDVVRQARSDPARTAPWRDYLATPIYDRYAPLFKAAGIGRSERLGFRAVKRRFRKALQRGLRRVAQAILPAKP